jgi:hypothetical protein
LLWGPGIGFSLHYHLKRGREIINYILVRVVIKHLFWVCLLKMLIREKILKKKANASIYCNVRGMNMFSYCIRDSR